MSAKPPTFAKCSSSALERRMVMRYSLVKRNALILAEGVVGIHKRSTCAEQVQHQDI